MAPKPIDHEEVIEDPEDAAEDDEPREIGTLYITRGGAEKLRAELKHLLTVERPKVTAEV